MTPLETILAGIVVSIVSGTIGARALSINKVSTKACDDHRSACIALVDAKLKALQDTVDKIWKKMENGN